MHGWSGRASCVPCQPEERLAQNLLLHTCQDQITFSAMSSKTVQGERIEGKTDVWEGEQSHPAACKKRSLLVSVDLMRFSRSQQHHATGSKFPRHMHTTSQKTCKLLDGVHTCPAMNWKPGKRSSI